MNQRGTGVALPEPTGPIMDRSENLRSRRRRHNKIKTLAAMFVAVIFGSLGDVSLSKGMKMVGHLEFGGPVQAFLLTITNFYVIAGMVPLILFLFLYLASLSWEELSFVLPLTAADYVLVTLLAYFLLHEDVSPLRWAGSVLVGLGIALVSRT